MLSSFYREKNPGKLAEVDKLLAKYNGNEEQMFRNLAKKYQLDPSVFGVSAGPPPATGGFGSPQAAGFGQQSTLGGGPSPFGQSASGFGQTPSQPFGGGPSAGSTPSHTFGSDANSSFGGASFGSLAHAPSPSPFGGAPTGGFGAPQQGFGAPAGGFSSPTPFGAPRR